MTGYFQRMPGSGLVQFPPCGSGLARGQIPTESLDNTFHLQIRYSLNMTFPKALKARIVCKRKIICISAGFSLFIFARIKVDFVFHSNEKSDLVQYTIIIGLSKKMMLLRQKTHCKKILASHFPPTSVLFLAVTSSIQACNSNEIVH